ncbi:MAG TPA: hypothetical protein VNZ44_03310 [Pyrinomonadaceae bacterium]|nr:hypothetical protein [Pyrinomonadaceae bacterium]
MNLLRAAFSKHALRLLFVILLPTAVAAQGAQNIQDTRRAEELWEQAVAAKGGREQLQKVESLLLSYRSTWRNFLGIVEHRGDVEALYAFPDKIWSWDDGLPPPFTLSVGWIDVSRNKRCHISKGSGAVTCGPARNVRSPGDEGLVRVQYLYLLETRWVKPTPVGVSEARIGFKKVDVLQTRFRETRIDYYLDRKTHLPARVTVFFEKSGRELESLDFSEYADVGGVMMPGKQERGHINFQINPPYDEAVFTRPPALEAGPHAWRRPGR